MWPSRLPLIILNRNVRQNKPTLLYQHAWDPVHWQHKWPQVWQHKFHCVQLPHSYQFPPPTSPNIPVVNPTQVSVMDNQGLEKILTTVEKMWSMFKRSGNSAYQHHDHSNSNSEYFIWYILLDFRKHSKFLVVIIWISVIKFLEQD